jgi:hypothetical protein
MWSQRCFDEGLWAARYMAQTSIRLQAESGFLISSHTEHPGKATHRPCEFQHGNSPYTGELLNVH